MSNVRTVKLADLWSDRAWPKDITPLMGDEEVLVVRRDGYILDGIRRCVAAQASGHKEAEAYVSDDVFDLGIELHRQRQGKELSRAQLLSTTRRLWELGSKRWRRTGDVTPTVVRWADYASEHGIVWNPKQGSVREIISHATGLDVGRTGHLIALIRALYVRGEDTAEGYVQRFLDGEPIYALREEQIRDGRITKAPGAVTRYTEQRQVLEAAVSSIASAVYALKKLGPLNEKYPEEDLMRLTDQAKVSREELTRIIANLRRDVRKRYEQG